MKPLSRILLIAFAFPTDAADARAEFVDVAASVGLVGKLPTWGAQAVDIDGDGDVDLVNGHHFYTVEILTNDGAGNFANTGIPQIVTDIQDRHGVLWADLDGDGWLDAACSHGGDGGCGCTDEGNELWRSTGGGHFELVPNAGGMFDAIGRGRAFSAADIDGDGDLDVFHAQAPLAGYPNALYRNDGAMQFVDVAAEWGLVEEFGTVGGLFADYDDDGDPDLLVGGEEFSRPTRLWRNDGGTFADDTAALGTPPVIAGADWGDYDADGDLDLAVCEGSDAIHDAFGVDDGTEFWFFAHHRYGDDGVDVFTSEALAGDPVAILEWNGGYEPSLVFLGPTGAHPAEPVVLLDDAYVGAPAFTPGVDQGLFVWRDAPGGAWNLHVSAPPTSFGNFSGRLYMPAGVASAGASNLEQPIVPPSGVRLYRNDGGTFTEVGAALGFSASANPRAVAWVDFDNDGRLDLHQMNKGTSAIGNEPDILYRNDGASFTPLDVVAGDAEHLTDGGVWADFDRDGDLDLFLQEGTGPSFWADLTDPILYRNDSATGHWLEVELTSASGATVVGAKVTCVAGDQAVTRRVSANSWRGFQGPMSLHFGLGDATLVNLLTVEWPGGATDVLGPFAVDQSVTVANATAAPGPHSEHAFVGPTRPQPSRGAQSVSFQLLAGARLRVAVYDVRGRRIRHLADDAFPRGRHEIVWDGRDDAGRGVGPGVYWIRATGDAPFVRRAVRLR